MNPESKSKKLPVDLTKRRIVRFWGRNYSVRPAVVDEKLGDGKQIVWFETFDTRPDYYILCVDSEWSLDNFGKDPLCDHIEEIREAIINQYGDKEETYEHDNGRTYTKHYPFPALHDGSGCACWGAFNRLKKEPHAKK